MSKPHLFLSLRWKLATLFGCVFLLMHSIFSYFAYRHAQEDFTANRLHEHHNHVRLARALSEDAYLVLEQLAEMLPLLGEAGANQYSDAAIAFTTLDEKWSQWQLSWGVEHIVFFGADGVVVKAWGTSQSSSVDRANAVLRTEMPEHSTVCAEYCRQQVIVPVISAGKTLGAYAVTRSFGDVMIKYRQATGVDIGILFLDDTLREAPGHPWPYRLAGLTSSNFNNKLYRFITEHVAMADLRRQNLTLRLDGGVFEIGVTPIPGNQAQQPLYLLINDITALDKRLQDDLRKVWLNGVMSLMLSLLLLPLLLYYTLARVSALSAALPLLAERQYDQFRARIAVKNAASADFDELDQLHQTALALAQQLETLEQEIHRNTLKLIEKSRELASERDFVKKLLDTAPLIILTQKLNGVILTVNQTGGKVLGQEERALKGKIFDLLLPEGELEHRRKLSRLRSGGAGDTFQCEGQLANGGGSLRSISWRHTRFHPPNATDGPVILSIGVDHAPPAAPIQHSPATTRLVYERFTALEYLPVLHSATLKPDHFDCRLLLESDEDASPAFTHTSDISAHMMVKKALQALRDSERLRQAPRLSITLSGNVFTDASFYPATALCFDDYRIDPAKIIFTLPEAALETHFEQAETLIGQLKTLGSGIALDDFGVSFSAFHYLQHLPIDYVKIDSQFLRQFEHNDDDRRFVQSLTDAAHTFGKLTIAKCVDRDDMRQLLVELGVDLVQGKLDASC